MQTDAVVIHEISPALFEGNWLPGGTPYPQPKWVPGRGGRSTRRTALSPFLLIMACISLALSLADVVVPGGLLRLCGLSLDPISTLLVPRSIAILAGTGLGSCLCRGRSKPAEWWGIVLAGLAALGLVLAASLLSKLVGGTNAASWLIAPVYLLWAWGSAVSGL